MAFAILAPMKCASWNVNSVRVRAEHVLDWLTAHQPDLLFLQEIKTDGTHMPDEGLHALGYHYDLCAKSGYAGVAMVIKQDKAFDRVTPALFDEEREKGQPRYIEYVIEGVHFINIYAPNGNPIDSEKYTYKLNWYNKLENYLNTLLSDNTPFIIGGDFNIIPNNKDCYNPRAWVEDALFTQEVRAIYRRLCHRGLYDCLRVFDQRAEHYTFWDYQGGAWPQNKGIRIDHFLASPEIADRLKSCEIDPTPRGWEKPSDHVPIIVELMG